MPDPRLPRFRHQPVDQGVGHRLGDVKPLHRDADLTAIGKGRPIEPVGDCVGVGIIKHDRGVIAAEFERHALQCRAGLGHDGASGRGAAGEGDLGDVGMRDQGARRVDATGKDGKNTGWQERTDQFAEPLRGQRRERRRLDDDGIAHRQSRGELPCHERDGEVPRCDRHDRADGPAHDLDVPPVVVGDDLRAGVHRREMAQPAGGAADLSRRFGYRLALLAGQQAGERIRLCFHCRGRRQHQARAVAIAGPGRFRRHGGSDRLSRLFGGGGRGRGDCLQGGRVADLDGRAP